jgi:hypothetical protein
MKILYKIVPTLLILGFFLSAFTHLDEDKDVKSAVETLFDGMRKGDSAMVHSVFIDDVRMYSSYITKEGKEILSPGSLENFLNAVGTPHDAVWDERIWNLKIEKDDNLAHAWMEYAFYAGGQFSHCGVNAMQLVKMDGNWKIVHLIDTRRKEKCNIPDEIKKQ